MMPKHSPEVMGWSWDKVEKSFFLRSGPYIMCMDLRWCVWSLYVWSGDMLCLLLREEDVFFWEKKTCYVFFWEKKICYVFFWEKKMSSSGRRRCLLLGEEYMLFWYDIRWYDMRWYDIYIYIWLYIIINK